MNNRISENAQRYFVTGVSMITSTGSLGDNVMAAEWTMQISYEPILMAVFVNENTATFKNIKETKEFGINVSADSQVLAVNIAGGYSRKEIDKLKIKDSFTFVKSKHIKAPRISGCVVNVECKLIEMRKFGDHTMIVGKALSIIYNKTKKPLLYHTGRYFRLGSLIESFRETVNVDKETFNWFNTEAKGKFVLKCVGILFRCKNKILVLSHVTKNKSYKTIPYLVPIRGLNYTKALNEYLKTLRLKTTTKNIPTLKRLILKNNKKFLRINFVLFKGSLKSASQYHEWEPIKSNSLLSELSN